MQKILYQWAGIGILSLIGWGVGVMPEDTSWMPSVIIWTIAFIWFVATAIYILKRKRVHTPIKSIVPSKLVLRPVNTIQTNGEFQIDTTVEIQVENHAAHMVKIGNAKLIMVFKKWLLKQKLEVDSLHYQIKEADGVRPIREYPIEIKPLSTQEENIFVVSFWDVIQVKKNYWNTSPIKTLIRFEFVGADVKQSDHDVEFDII